MYSAQCASSSTVHTVLAVARVSSRHMGTKERIGRAVLPDWWKALVFPKLRADKRSQQEIAEEASKRVGRESDWDKSAISRFLSETAVTRELANALSDMYEQPRPFFEARSPEEANAYLAVQRRFDTRSPATPETISRRSRALSALDRIVDQTKPVVSKHEGSPRGRGHRRASDRR